MYMHQIRGLLLDYNTGIWFGPGLDPQLFRPN
jgi:hypothetical protein